MEKSEKELLDQKLDLVSYRKIKPMDLCKLALNKRKSKRIKSKIRKRVGVSKLYWDHTKNYSKDRKIKTEEYVKQQLKTKKLKDVLRHYKKKPTYISLLKKIVQEATKNCAISDENRANIWLIFSNTTSQMRKNKNYYYYLNSNCLKSKKHFDRIIKMDVMRTRPAVENPKHAQMLTNVLTNFAKRNAKVGYCQGLNFLASFFLERGFKEEEAFWIMVYIIEEAMPNEYYTNMLSVIADLKILQILFKIKQPSLYKHFQALNIDLMMIALPCFITIFTNCVNDLTDIVIDNFFIHGPIVLLKSMILFFGYMKNQLLELEDLPGVLKFFDGALKKIKVSKARFDADLKKFYLSKFMISELRKFYTEKERKVLAKQKKSLVHNIGDCEPDWPICYYTLFKKSMYHRSPSFHLHRTKGILDNYNPNHFNPKRKNDRGMVDVSEITTKDFDDEKDIQNYIEDQLLIVRTRHLCKFMKPNDVILKNIKEQRDKMIPLFELNKLKSIVQEQDDTFVVINEDNGPPGFNLNKDAFRKNSRRGDLEEEGRRRNNTGVSYSSSPTSVRHRGSSIANYEASNQTLPIKSLIRGLKEEQDYGFERVEDIQERRRIKTMFDDRLSNYILDEFGTMNLEAPKPRATHFPLTNKATGGDIKPKARVVNYYDLNNNGLEILHEDGDDDSYDAQSIVKRISIAQVNLDKIRGSASMNVRENLARFLKRVESNNFANSHENE